MLFMNMQTDSHFDGWSFIVPDEIESKSNNNPQNSKVDESK